MNPNILLNRPAIRGHELRKGVEAFAHHVCSGLNLRPVKITWTGGIPTAAINSSGAMWLAAVRDDALIKRSDVLRYLGFVVHELLHRRYTDFSVAGTGSRMLDQLHNAIEDAWIERRAIRFGLLGNIEALLTGLLSEMTAQARAQVQDWTDPVQYPFVLAVVARGYPGVTVPVAAGLEPIFAEASRRVDNCQSSTDTLEVARWVLDQLKQIQQPPQQPPQQPQQGEQGQQQGNGEGEPGDDQQQGEDDQPGQGQPGKGEPGEGEQPGQQPGQGDDQPGQGEPGNGEPGEGQGDGQGQQQGEPCPGPARQVQGNEEARPVEPELSAPEGTEASGTFSQQGEIKKPGRHLHHEARHVLDRVSSPRLEVDVRRLFEDSGLTLFSPGRKAGSINAGALGRFGTTERLFKQRRDIEGIDSAVVIVLDVSDSMFLAQTRIKSALAACELLVRVLQRAGVAVCVTSFGSVSSVLIPWGTPTPKAAEMLTRVLSGTNTNDHAALKHAHDLLLARPESRRVCFVLTDGEGNKTAAREQVRAGEVLGVSTIGIGIQLDVSSVYPRSILVRDMGSLATASLKQIKLAA